MVVDVTKIEDAMMPFSFRVEAEKLDLDTPNYRVVDPVLVTGEIERHIASVKVRGDIAGTVEVDCTRCLQPVQRPLAIDFDVEYLTEGQLGREGEHELHETDLDRDELEGSSLDLTQLAREQILLNVPEQFLCREDCKGLCEKCGENINLVDCNCGKDEIDPRWAALKDLKDSIS
jgi:uncharacterized protein